MVKVNRFIWHKTQIMCKNTQQCLHRHHAYNSALFTARLTGTDDRPPGRRSGRWSRRRPRPPTRTARTAYRPKPPRWWSVRQNGGPSSQHMLVGRPQFRSDRGRRQSFIGWREDSLAIPFTHAWLGSPSRLPLQGDVMFDLFWYKIRVRESLFLAIVFK